MRRTAVLLALASTLALACKGKDNTKIVVAVWSDLAVPAELDSIRIDVDGTGSKNFPLTPGSDPSAPLAQLELVPLGAKNETFTVTATGLYGPTDLVAQTARVSFVAGQSLLLKLFLAGACEGRPCTEVYTCAAGFCNQPTAVPNLPPYTGGIIGTGGAGTGGAVVAGDWAGWPMPNDQVDVTAGAPNLESYTDNGDGTVTDNVTGLMWQQAVSATTYTWVQAVAYCPTLRLAGHSDWRLPSRIELVSIVDLGVTSGSGGQINATYFPSWPASGEFRFWTSSPPDAGASFAWYVDFAFGGTDSLHVSNTWSVRCVR
jgi:hypothetical protein